jgi:cytochrome c oxidase subunit 2
VIHSFFLPNFRVKQDAMPGMTVETWFVPREAGDFEIACAEHCGLGHYRMRGQVHVVSAAQLDSAIATAMQ